MHGPGVVGQPRRHRRATAYKWYSIFFEKPLVSRVYRRICIRIVRLLRSTCDELSSVCLRSRGQSWSFLAHRARACLSCNRGPSWAGRAGGHARRS